MRRFIREENTQKSSKWVRLIADYVYTAVEDEYVDVDNPTELYDDIDPEDCSAGVGIHFVVDATAPYRRGNDPTQANYNTRPEEYEYYVKEASIWAGEDNEEEFDVTSDLQKYLDAKTNGSEAVDKRKFLNRRDLPSRDSDLF